MPSRGWDSTCGPGRCSAARLLGCSAAALTQFPAARKTFWYEGPSLGSHLTYKPSQLEILTKSTSNKTKKESDVCRGPHGLLRKALADLPGTRSEPRDPQPTGMWSSPRCLCLRTSRGRVSGRTVSAGPKAHTGPPAEKRATPDAPLMSQRTRRNGPATVFVQDEALAATEADRLPAIADVGPP